MGIGRKDLGNVKTRFIKDGSLKDGILRNVDYDKQAAKIKLKSELVSIDQGELELFYQERGKKEELLLKQDVRVEYNEYELESTGQLKGLFSKKLLKGGSKSCNNDNDRKRLLFNLLQKDGDQVTQEIIQERSSRGLIFVTTLGAMSTAAFVLITLGGKQPLSRWIFGGVLVPMVLLTISILANIHKTRAINLRSSYLAALNSFIAEGRIPKFFAGWQNALQVHKLCILVCGIKC